MGSFVTYSEAAIDEGFAKKDLSDPETQTAINQSLSVKFRGAFNAATKSPPLSDAVGVEGDYYQVSVAGTSNFGHGAIVFNYGDYVTYDNGLWSRVAVVPADLMNPWQIDLDPSMPAHAHNTWFTIAYAAVAGGVYNTSGSANGSFIDWKVDMPGGQWYLDLMHSRLVNGGIMMAYTDAQASVDFVDTYAAATLNNVNSTINLGVIPRGTHTVKLLVVDKNASSTGYIGRLQKARLRRMP